MYNRIELDPTVPEICLEIEELYSTYAYLYSPKYSFRGESHEAWELIYTNSGEVTVETPEYQTILSKGQVFIHVPGEFHKIKANNVSCNMYFISFKCECGRLYEIAQKPISIPPSLKNYITAIVEEGSVYLAGKNDIPLAKNKTPGFAAGQIIKNFIELLLIELIRRNSRADGAENAEAETTQTQKSVVEYIVGYMKENIRNKLKLAQIALDAGYSVPRICSIFRKVTGVSIMNFFIKLRIHKAKQLMSENKLTIGQISEYLAFDTIQYFSSQFKKITKMTPSQYADYLKLRNYRFDDAENLQFFT